MTAKGTIVGTLHYMAPEQIEGREADARSDLWAFGCVLYEMLTGARPFDGKTTVSVAAAILEREPEPLRARQPTTPAGVEHVIARCLTKDPDERWQSARDVLGELQWIGQSTTAATTAAAPQSRFGSAVRAGLWLAVGALIASAVTAWWRAVPPDAAPVMQFDIAPEGGTQSMVTLSPDGRYVATLQDRPDGRARISLRTLTEGPARHVVDLEGRVLVGLGARQRAACWRPQWSTDHRPSIRRHAVSTGRVGDSGRAPGARRWPVRRGPNGRRRLSLADVVGGWTARERDHG